MVESDIQPFAGGPRPLGSKGSQEQWQHVHLPTTGAKLSTRSQAYSQAVSHGDCSMCSVLYFSTGFLTWAWKKTKPNQGRKKEVSSRSLIKRMRRHCFQGWYYDVDTDKCDFDSKGCGQCGRALFKTREWCVKVCGTDVTHVVPKKALLCSPCN